MEPRSAARLRSELQLSLTSGVGPRIRAGLLKVFGDFAAIERASPGQLRAVPGIGAGLANEMVRVRESSLADRVLQQCRQDGIEILLVDESGYPPLLTEIPDPPALLYRRGDWVENDGLAVAIVGSRRASAYGRRTAERFGRELGAAGVTVASGLARGVDAAAHRGALAAGGRTIAILGSGVANIYPPENADLANEITRRGSLLSEFPPARPPKSGAFPRRNRIITGISLGVIVIEASARSGALISARHAMEQNREVFAVPGRIDNDLAQGCHQLIRDGAKLVESLDHVIEELGPLAHPVSTDAGDAIRQPRELQLNELERAVLNAVQLDPTAIDDVIHDSGLNTPQVLATVSVLEMRRLIKRFSSGFIARV
ncbi:MAG: DNA-processing protein DprA [Pirellulaceae bacterium]|jgi:DNA processing protein|nr:DNA-processing protein DprA [Pirellulaceae bacterium]MDP7017791.1 DNA-processing protein DprA [Pirellulaceae bacterium]